MATVTGLTVVKSFTYRGAPDEEFSNTYHFKNPPPGDDASWMVLVNDVLTLEQSIYGAAITFQRAYGYDSNDAGAHHVFVHDWTIPGPPPVGTMTDTGALGAGDQAACVWFKMNRLSSRGKPVYCRKYHHHPHIDITDPDKLDQTYRDQLFAYAAGGTGIFQVHGGLRSASTDDTVITPGVIPWVTTRTLKRRGKRPRTGS